MRSSLIFSIIGGVFGILIAFFVYLFGIFVTELEEYDWFESGEGEQLMTQAMVAIFGSIIGIVGGAIGRRIGGMLLIVGAVITLVAEGFFGVLPFVFLIIGGIFALREKSAKATT